MSEIKNVGETWMAKCNHLTPQPFKGLNLIILQQKTIQKLSTYRCI